MVKNTKFKHYPKELKDTFNECHKFWAARKEKKPLLAQELLE
ncbi:MAG: hypothetical protein ACOC5T_07360 [Elusimicrobiota bacterium]